MMFLPLSTLIQDVQRSSFITKWTLSLDGVPVCPIGRKMIGLGIRQEKISPKMAMSSCSWKMGMPQPCSRFYIWENLSIHRQRIILVFFLRVKRDSKEWYKRYSLRTGVERCIKRQKVDYHLEDSRGRSSRHWSIRTYCIGMCQHADAWTKEAEKK